LVTVGSAAGVSGSSKIPGLPLMFDIGSLVFFDCGGVRLMLTHPEKPEFDHPAPFCTLSTSLLFIGKC